MIFLSFIFSIAFSDTPNLAPTCYHYNYKAFIHDYEKTKNLIEQTQSGCELYGIDLSHQDLSHSYFLRADLRGAHLSHSDLRASTFLEASLEGVHMVKVKAKKAFWSRAHMKRADFTEAHLEEGFFLDVDLKEAQLVKAKMFDAFLVGADLSFADLQGADLRGANLLLADLAGVRARRTSFSRAKIEDTRFFHADLTGADFSTTDISLMRYNEKTNFTCAAYDFVTVFPKKFPQDQFEKMIEVPYPASPEEKSTLIEECLNSSKTTK